VNPNYSMSFLGIFKGILCTSDAFPEYSFDVLFSFEVHKILRNLGKHNIVNVMKYSGTAWSP